MNVTEATQRSASIRSFLPDPVTNEQIKDLLEVASRAPSGGNVQPWRVYVINGTLWNAFDRLSRVVNQEILSTRSTRPVFKNRTELIDMS